MVQCCRCGANVTNQTAKTQAPACDKCQDVWRRQGLTQAVMKCLANQVRVILPDGTEITADDLDRVLALELASQ